jgi:hypothetical protein
MLKKSSSLETAYGRLRGKMRENKLKAPQPGKLKNVRVYG